MGFLEALLLAFIILKLTGVITWPWLVVLLPLLPDVILYVTLAIFGVGIFRRVKHEHKSFDEEFKAFDKRFDRRFPNL